LIGLIGLVVDELVRIVVVVCVVVVVVVERVVLVCHGTMRIMIPSKLVIRVGIIEISSVRG
jgi:hypothetical protein